MTKYQQKYKSSLTDGRLSDKESVDRFLREKATAEALVRNLSMSTSAEDKPILSLAFMLHVLFSNSDTSSSICASIVKTLYERDLHDIHCRISELEEKNTAKYWWSRIQWVSEAGKVLLTIAAVIALIKGLGI